MLKLIQPKNLLSMAALLGVALAVFWALTVPRFLPNVLNFGNSGNAVEGEDVFNIAGCGSCHSADGAEAEDKLILSGGRSFPSPFGTFYAPNISPDPEFGIGGWSTYDLANAMMNGVSPNGKHYYPAFPYTSFARMEIKDIIDLKAFLDSLPLSSEPSVPHDLPFFAKWRRPVGVWKQFFFDPAPIYPDSADGLIERGRYLVEGPGHCTECHTSRNLLGGLIPSAYMAGAPAPEGPGFVPNITPHADGLESWTENQIAQYLSSGFTPEFDSVGGLMVEVVENTALLSAEDRRAIAAYLKSIPPTATPERE